MSSNEPWPLTAETLLGYFLEAARPRESWLVGMELEKMARDRADGRPVDYEGQTPSIRGILEYLKNERGGDPVYEGEHLIGLDAPWGAISLEPGGQVEWSSRPARNLSELSASLNDHLAILGRAADDLGVRWLDEALDPECPLERMCWMPKARYRIMRPYLGSRGSLAHRMMTQTASIQCAFDYSDAEDWRRKFKTAALMSPVATALFANSSRMEGAETGYRCYRQAIWRDTDPDRCGLPPVVFSPDFRVESWLDWVLQVPTIFLHRARGLVPAGGIPFRGLMERTGCDAIHTEDWETHISSIFTEVRSYSYIEVRSADLQPDSRAIAVPTFWVGLLYQQDALEAAMALGAGIDEHAAWTEAMDEAARNGLEGRFGDRELRPIAEEAISIAIGGLRGGAACVDDGDAAAESLVRLAQSHDLRVRE